MVRSAQTRHGRCSQSREQGEVHSESPLLLHTVRGMPTLHNFSSRDKIMDIGLSTGLFVTCSSSSWIK
ncbi:hypothetical protein VZT92_000661 [Zoarces viviparus]|uniref:Uncharacterized protein n=1 Tax=Zoarces viviparus TaxID=48416 RepID=A0AAW1G7L8_ZOAVI